MRFPWRRLTRGGGSEGLLAMVLVGTAVLIALLVVVALLIDRT